VLGTLTWVALAPPSVSYGERIEVHADRPEATDNWLLEGTVVFSALQVSAGDLPADRLLDGTAISYGDPWVRTTPSPGQTRVRLDGARNGVDVHFFPGRGQRWDLTVADDLPLQLDLDLAFDRGELDLSRVEVTRIDLHGAFNDLRLRLGAPARDVRVNVEGAFNALTLVVPDEVPVRTDTDGFLNLIGRRRDRPAGGAAGYRLRVEGAFSRTRVRSR
jgi:hypothetical protein